MVRNNIFATSVYGLNLLGDKYNVNKFITGSIGGLVGSIISQPIDYLKTNIQSKNNISYKQLIFNKNTISRCMDGTLARSSVCFLSMGIGSFVYNYFKLLDI